MTVNKHQLFEHCRQLLLDKKNFIQQRLLDSQDTAAGETKRTAGDKHETALAMLQLEQEQLRRQLQEATEQLAHFDRLAPVSPNSRVVAGSLVRTDKGTIYIATGIGRIAFAGETITVISAAAPLGKALMGSGAEDRIPFNGTSYIILSVE